MNATCEAHTNVDAACCPVCLLAERDRLRRALIGLVGVESRKDLREMELVMRAIAAPWEDKIAMLDAIHALLATMK